MSPPSSGHQGRRIALGMLLVLLWPVAASAVTTVLVRPTDKGIWRTALYDSGTGKTYVTGTTSNGAFGDFTTGPATPPAGLGSFRQHIGSTGVDGQRVETQRYGGKKFNFFGQLRYWTYVTTSSSSLATTMVILADVNGDGIMVSGLDEVLTFEPRNQTGAVPLPAGYSAPNQCGSVPGCVAAATWQEWNAKVGAWAVTKFGDTAPQGYATLESYQAAHPLALLANDRPSFQLSAGFGGIPWVWFDGFIDAVRINDATYDFENPPTAPVVTAPLEAATVYGSPVTINGTVQGETGAPLQGATVTVREGQTVLGTSVTAASGTWSVATPMSDGFHVVAVTATLGGYTSPTSSRSFFVQWSPTILTPAVGATLHSTVSTVEGTAGPGQTVKVYEGPTMLGSAMTAPGCTAPCAWSVGPFVFNEGPHTVAATSSDGSGESPPAIRSFTVEIKPVITSPPTGFIKVTTPFVSGTAGQAMTIEVYEGATLLGTTATGGTCTFPCAWTIGSATFGEGPHTITAYAIEGSTTSAPFTRAFTVDITPPGPPTITLPAEGAVMNTTSIMVSGTAEPGSQVDVFEGTVAKGAAIAGPTGLWQTTALFNVGTHTIKAVATDEAGNASLSSALRSFKVEFNTPVAPVISAPLDGAYVKSPVTVAGTAPAGTTVTLYEGPNVIAKTTAPSGTWSLSLVMLGGSHRPYARATDSFGHASLPSATIGFTVDAIPPAITFGRQGDLAFVGVPFLDATAPAGQAGDDIGIDHVTVTYNSLLISAPGLTRQATCVGCPSRFVSWTDSPPLAPGLYRVTAQAYDRAGNASVTIRSYLVQLGP